MSDQEQQATAEEDVPDTITLTRWVGKISKYEIEVSSCRKDGFSFSFVTITSDHSNGDNGILIVQEEDLDRLISELKRAKKVIKSKLHNLAFFRLYRAWRSA
jgi:hypothetical protein